MSIWNVMLVDDDKLFGAALSALLENSNFKIGRECTNLPEAISVLKQAKVPDLILLDLEDGSLEELSQLRRLRQLADKCRVVVLATEMSPQILSISLQAGTDGYLNKSMSWEALQRSLNLVMLGEAVFPSSVTSLLMTSGADYTAPARAQPLANELSKREIQILRCLLAGQSNKAIARNLSITESTVKMHFKNVMRKIHAQNRTQAAVWAIQNGISPQANA